MSKLTINAIRKNPWNVLLMELPPQPGRLLLEAALLAAHYCRDCDGMFLKAASDGRLRFYVKNQEDIREAYDECDIFYEAACYKLEEISNLFESDLMPFSRWCQ